MYIEITDHWPAAVSIVVTIIIAIFLYIEGSRGAFCHDYNNTIKRVLATRRDAFNVKKKNKKENNV